MNELVRNVLMGAAGAAGDSIFVDDVFSTYLYRGTGNQIVINNGIDLSEEGGLVWMKNRDTTYSHFIFDTERGTTKKLNTNSNSGEGTETAGVNAFNSNGFSIGTNGTNDGAFNHTSYDYASWTFRKAPGFLDIVTYTGTGSVINLSHNLGCVPGCVMIKKTSATDNWSVYHRGLDDNAPEDYWIALNGTFARMATANITWNSTKPTSTHVTIGAGDQNNNTNGATYVAYIFAGGASTAATARSVDLDGNDWLTVPNSSDFNTGSGDFTIEAWIKPDASATSYNAIWSYGNPHEIMWRLDGSAEKIQASFKGTEGGSYVVELASTGTDSQRTPRGQWSHVAIVRNGNNFNLYLNGNLADNATYSGSIAGAASDSGQVGNYIATGNPSTYPFKGFISNFRFVKGTAVYTSSFRPPTEPLTNITNTKLLCCNNSSVTGSTVAPSSTNTYSINVTASSSSAYTLSGNDRNGSVSGNNVTVTANVGDTLNFAVNASGHPFYIRVSNGGYNVSTPAATGQGSQSGTVSWTPNTAGSFVYQCGNHSGMIGTITINAASGSITANGDPTASTHVPFDDPEGFQFGEGGNQNIIKCGNYTGNGSSLDVELGFEPSWVMIKSSTETYNWIMSDVMRGLPAIGDGRGLFANTNNAEFNYGSVARPRATGFNVTETQANNNGSKFIYIAIRRPDGLVGKPAEAGTDVFATDTGSGSSAGPEYDSGFPVDFAIHRTIASTNDWWTSAKLIRGKHLETNNTGAQSTSDAADYVFDYNDGWYKNGYGSGVQSWMWKRHAGFDVVAYKGNSVFASNGGHAIAHNLSKTPEMIWVKDRDQSSNWHVFHKDLTGNNILILNLSAGTSGTGGDSDDFVSVSSTHFTIGYENAMNNSSRNYLAMLFASVDGISKVGSYSGTGSAGHVITTGFTPRFLIIKTTNASNSWFVYDSVRGLGAGADPYLQLENTNTQGGTSDDVFATSSTGFTINQNYPSVNASGQNYIYYAHA